MSPKRTILTWGLIAGVVSISMMLATMPFADRIGFEYGMVIGYTALVLSALLVSSSASAESFWDGGLRVLCLLLVCKLWQRRHNGDYLQAYVVSFVMLLAATFVENSMVYALLLFLYLVFAMWTLTLFHLRREMEENYLLKHLPGRHAQAAESERVEVERILNSRRVVGFWTPAAEMEAFLAEH